MSPVKCRPFGSGFIMLNKYMAHGLLSCQTFCPIIQPTRYNPPWSSLMNVKWGSGAIDNWYNGVQYNTMLHITRAVWCWCHLEQNDREVSIFAVLDSNWLKTPHILLSWTSHGLYFGEKQPWCNETVSYFPFNVFLCPLSHDSGEVFGWTRQSGSQKSYTSTCIPQTAPCNQENKHGLCGPVVKMIKTSIRPREMFSLS